MGQFDSRYGGCVKVPLDEAISDQEIQQWLKPILT
jgi:hypothetical protein